MCAEAAGINELVDQEGLVAKPTQIAQGGSLPVTFDRDGESIDGWTATIYVKQHVKDDATIVRQLAVDPENPLQWSGLLTSADTSLLSVGLWHVFANLNNATTGEARQVKGGSIRFEVTETIFTTISTTIDSVIGNFLGIARFNFSGTIVSVGQTVTNAGFTAGADGYNGDKVIVATNLGGDEWFETAEVFTISQTTGIFTHLG